MVQRHLEQQINDTYLIARNGDEDRPPTGAPSKRKAKGKRKANATNISDREDCIPKHDPNKEGNGKGMTSLTFSGVFSAPKLER